MPEENENPDPNTPPEGGTTGGQEPPKEPFDEARALAKIASVNSEAAGLRARLKTAEAAAVKLQEIEDGNKSAEDKFAERLAALEKTAADAAARADRAEIAAAKGLTAAQAARLMGDSREALEADADELLKLFGTPPKGTEDTGTGAAGDGKTPDPKAPPKAPGKPKELSSGNSPEQDTSETDVAKLGERMFRR